MDEGHQYELDEAVWDKVMNVNVKGVFLCARAAARKMCGRAFERNLNLETAL